MDRPAPVAHGDDRRQLPDAAGPGVSTGHQLGTWPTSEVEDVDTAIIFSSAARSSPHRVDTHPHRRLFISLIVRANSISSRSSESAPGRDSSAAGRFSGPWGGR